MLRSHRELEAWQRAFRLCTSVYRLSAQLPSDERFGLISQMRRAAVSVPANIAEGYNRGARREYLQYLWIARGSLSELETHILLASELGFLKEAAAKPVLADLNDIERLIKALIRSPQPGKAPTSATRISNPESLAAEPPE